MSTYRQKRLFRRQVIVGLATFATAMLFFVIGCMFDSLFIPACAAGEIVAFAGFITVVLMGYRRIELRLDLERRELGLNS